ncbi:transmembrane protein 19 [Phlebotomus argentipes]|uniref:transmembrane protein 19 n=1 Tax=Phlebotomus argentipes TaxID=94469 RepID=UPI002893673C|nr:transmembrane protein 19 [Phlebotomus argentipes]
MEKRPSRFYTFLPIFICSLAIPLSMFMWLGHLAFIKFTTHPEYDDTLEIPPTRWLASVLIPIFFAVYGYRRKSVNASGAVLGFVIAVVLTVANYAFLGCLLVFFLSSSRATKFRAAQKAKIEEDFKGGEGKRNWIQVLCNGGMALQLSLLYLIDCGPGERPIDFSRLYRSSWLGIALLSAFACCNGDTWASELGSVLAKADPFLITTRKRVPRGTNGGVTLVGLVVSFLGGLVIGLMYFLTVIYTVDRAILLRGPVQWPLIAFGGIAGLLGSVIDSLIGATMQYSGQDEQGHIVERPGKGVRHISGIRILDNHSVNLISSIATGVIMPSLAVHFWP